MQYLEIMRLHSIIPSPRAGKKYRAIFEDSGKMKHTDFGASGMEDYTTHKDPERRERYLSRHRRDLETNDPTRACYLSYYILWGPSTSFDRNVQLYKTKFGL